MFTDRRQGELPIVAPSEAIESATVPAGGASVCAARSYHRHARHCQQGPAWTHALLSGVGKIEAVRNSITVRWRGSGARNLRIFQNLAAAATLSEVFITISAHVGRAGQDQRSADVLARRAEQAATGPTRVWASWSPPTSSLARDRRLSPPGLTRDW